MNCKELIKEELKDTNGCGSSYWLVSWIRLPDFVSKALTRCCNRHDIRYQNQEKKAFADDELYDCLMYNAFHSPWWQKRIKIWLTELMYKLVTCKVSNLCYKKGAKDAN